jgi:hypothetical protein
LHILAYRAWELYGYGGPSGQPPKKPALYDHLQWPEIGSLPGRGVTRDEIEARFLKKMIRRRKDALAHSVRVLGWTFSDYMPEARLPLVEEKGERHP